MEFGETDIESCFSHELSIENRDLKISEIIPGQLYLSSYTCASNEELLRQFKITHVLTVAGEFVEHFQLPSEFEHVLLDVEDNESDLVLQHFDFAYQYFSKVLESRGRLLIHCMAGMSRSVSVVASVLMKHTRITSDEALKAVELKRGLISPNLGFVKQLKLFEKMNFSLEGDTKYHKIYKVMNVAWLKEKQRLEEVNCLLDQTAVRSDPLQGYHCVNCNEYLFHSGNTFSHVPYDVDLCFDDTDCPLFIEPMRWMFNSSDLSVEEGQLMCPNCSDHVGHYTWIGDHCEECNSYVKPFICIRRDKVAKKNTS